MSAETNKILIVESDNANVDILKIRLELEGFAIQIATDGKIAWNIIQKEFNSLCAVILDQDTKTLDGLMLAKLIKSHPNAESLPVIMHGESNEPKDLIDALSTGVTHYFARPFSKEVMVKIVKSLRKIFSDAKVLAEKVDGLQHSMQQIEHCEMFVVNYAQIHKTACFVSNLFPEPAKVLMGIEELLRNAVEHGNLGITYDEKTELLKDNILVEEITRREGLEENKTKRVFMRYRREANACELYIRDEGDGFDWQQYMEVSADRMRHHHGRGIAMANLCSFDVIQYQGKGNEVLCTCYTQSP